MSSRNPNIEHTNKIKGNYLRMRQALLLWKMCGERMPPEFGNDLIEDLRLFKLVGLAAFEKLPPKLYSQINI